MADTKKTFNKKRPSFAAPTPPTSSGDVVSNKPEETKSADVVEEVITPTTSPEPQVPQEDPGIKTVTKSKSASDSSSLDQVLSENGDEEKANNQLPVDDSDTPPPGKKCTANFLLVGITVFSIVLAVSGWALYINTSSDMAISLPGSGDSSDEPNEEAAPTQQPSPTTYPKEDITLEVLNGSGTAGAAGDTGESLENLGYTVVKIGNADNQDYEATLVYISADFEDSQVLIDDLESEFGPASVSGELEDSDALAQIILGANWFSEAE